VNVQVLFFVGKRRCCDPHSYIVVHVHNQGLDSDIFIDVSRLPMPGGVLVK
jgi:hypothetical protein